MECYLSISSKGGTMGRFFNNKQSEAQWQVVRLLMAICLQLNKHAKMFVIVLASEYVKNFTIQFGL